MPQLTNKLSAIVTSQIPEFIRGDNEAFSEFIKAYYKFLELEKNSQELIQNLKKYADIDETIASLIDRFFDMYGTGVPSNISADVSIFIKRIKDLYTSKGTENAYNLLFTILYNEAIEFFYPWDVVLKASDGKWIQLYSLIAKPIDETLSNNTFKFNNSKIVGETSGASAIVNSVFKYKLGSADIFEIFIDRESITGQFIENEKITTHKLNDDKTVSYVEAQLCPILTDVNIIDGAMGYSIGDDISITPSTGTIVFAEVSGVDNFGKILNINVKKTGIAYYSNTTVIAPSPSIIEKNIEFKLNNNIITLYFPSSHGLSRGSNITISYTDSNNILNGIEQTLLVTSMPSRRTLELRANGDYLDVFSYGTATIKYNDIAVLEPVISTVKVTEGYWKNTDGKLSENMIIEGRLSNASETDPVYYQPFSYVIKSQHSISEWKNYATKLIHPAGMQVFGELMIQNTKNDAPNGKVLSAGDADIGDVETYTADLTTINVDTYMHKADFTYVYHKLF